MEKQIISHIRHETIPQEEWIIQTNKDHCRGVAELAGRFAGEFGCAEWGRAMGLLHDKGKEKRDFQNYIRKVTGYDPAAPPYDDKTHAYVGALLADKIYGKGLSLVLANAIMGHHAGLYDYPDFEEKMKSPLPGEIEDDVPRCTLPPKKLEEPRDFHHFVRVLYSCLVDADFLDTERFMNPEAFRQRFSGIEKIDELSNSLGKFLSDIKKNAPDTRVNRIRDRVQELCREAAGRQPGFYSLTVPTGGGKTLSSIVWAVNHALKYGKKRIIIAIPYTSIIVQTAENLRGVFGAENVLEHHSNFEPGQLCEEDNSLKYKMKLATENWDYPIVVTTNVQLFESLFSNKPSSCRKLHNICNSVLILDEVQTLPVEYLQPIVDSLKTFQRCFGVSVLFTTASLPAFEGRHKGSGQTVFSGIDGIEEIVPSECHLHEELRRVSLSFDKEACDYDTIARRISEHDKVLCIVNTRRDAREIYSRLPKEELTLHLSRMMCPKHLSWTIAKIKQTLKDKSCKVIRVVATQLIEAGVDIDFPVVYRQMAGLDSILQAAGRCNREGKLSCATAYIFSLKGSRSNGYIRQTVDAQKTMLEVSGEADWFAPETMKKYFEQVYCRIPDFDKAMVKEYLYKPCELSFKTAAEQFKLIDDTGQPVIVNYGDSLDLVEQLRQHGPSYSLMKQLNQYTVMIRQNDFEEFKKSTLAQEVTEGTGIYVVAAEGQYSQDVGLILENHWLDEILIIGWMKY